MLYAPRYAPLHASAPAHKHTDQSQRTNTDTRHVTQQTPDTAQHRPHTHTAQPDQKPRPCTQNPWNITRGSQHRPEYTHRTQHWIPEPYTRNLKP